MRLPRGFSTAVLFVGVLFAVAVTPGGAFELPSVDEIASYIPTEVLQRVDRARAAYGRLSQWLDRAGIHTATPVHPQMRRLDRVITHNIQGRAQSHAEVHETLLQHQRKLQSLRESLLDNNIGTPYDLAPASKNFIRSFPRFQVSGQSAPNRVPNLKLMKEDQKAFEKGAQAYGEGAALVVAIPFVLALLMPWCCCCFCCCRCCCGWCGGRKPSHRYSRKERRIAKLNMFLLFAVFFTVGMLAYSGSSGLSTAVDESFKTGRAFVNFGYNVALVANSSREVAVRAFDIVKDLNRTVMEVIPSAGRIAQYRSCLVSTFSILDIKDGLLGTLNSLNAIVLGLVDFSQLNTTVNSLDLAITTLPDLNALQAELVAMNTTLNNLPGADQMKADLTSLNATMNALSTLDTIASKLETLDATIAAIKLQPIADDLVSFDSALSLMPDLDVLHTDAGRSSGVDSTVRTRMQTNLIALNNSINTMPGTLAMRSKLLVLDGQIPQLRSALDINVSSLSTALNGIPDLGRVYNNILLLVSFQNSSAASIASLKPTLGKIDTAIGHLPSMPVLLSQVISVDNSIKSIQSVDLNATAELLVALKNSINGLSCITIVFDDIRRVNTTIVVLPSSVSSVFDVENSVRDVLNDTSQYTRYIDDGLTSLNSVIKSIGDLPNFTSIINQVRTFNSSLNTLPNISSTIANLNNMQQTLNNVPDLNSYLSQVLSLNSSIKVPDLSSTSSSLASINASLSTMPALGPFVNNLGELNATLNGLGNFIDLAYAAVAHPAYIPNGIQPPSLRTTFQAKIAELNASLATRPNTTALLLQIRSVNSTMNTRPNISNIIASIRSLNSTVGSFPNLGSLSGSVDNLKDIRGNTAALDSLIGTTMLADLNTSVTSLPDFAGLKTQITDMDKSTKDLNLNTTINQLNIDTGSVNKTDILKQFDDVAAKRGELNKTDEYLNDVQKLLDDMADNWKDVEKYHRESHDDIDAAQADANEFDGYRLAVMDIIIVIPFAMTLLGLCGCVCNKGAPPMFMALAFFPLATIYFVLAGLQMPVAVILSDHCPVLETMAHEAFGDSVINITSVNLTDVLQVDEAATHKRVSEVFDYFTQCKGHFELLDAVGPNEITSYFNRKEWNVSVVLNDLENPTDGSDRYILRQPIRDLMFRAESLLPLLDAILFNLKNSVSCGATSHVYTLLRNTLCMHLAGSWALTASMFFLLAVCMIPGICVGVRAYKRFPKKWSVSAAVTPFGLTELARQRNKDSISEAWSESSQDIRGARPAVKAARVQVDSAAPVVVNGAPVVSSAVPVYGNGQTRTAPRRPRIVQPNRLSVRVGGRASRSPSPSPVSGGQIMVGQPKTPSSAIGRGSSTRPVDM